MTALITSLGLHEVKILEHSSSSSWQKQTFLSETECYFCSNKMAESVQLVQLYTVQCEYNCEYCNTFRDFHIQGFCSPPF